MLTILLQAAFSSTNAAVFKLAGSTGCPDSVTTEVTDLNEELLNTNQKQITAYIGKDGASVNEASIGTKDVSFVSCGDVHTITLSLDDSVQTKKITLNKLTATIPSIETLSDLHFSDISVTDSKIEKGGQYTWHTDVHSTDILSGASSAIKTMNSKNLTLRGEDLLQSLNISSNVFSPGDSQNFTYTVSVSEYAYVEYKTTNQFYLSISNLTVPLTIRPLANGTHIKLTYDSTINKVTVDNRDITTLKISSKDVTDLNLNTVDSSNKIVYEKITPISTKLNVGQIIGIVIAVLLIVACILACVFIAKCEAKEQAEDEAVLRGDEGQDAQNDQEEPCLLYTSPSPRD